jgi:hypothetical protein
MGKIKTPVFVGGKTAVSHQQQLEQSGIICLGEKIAGGLQLVNKSLQANKPR